MTQNICFFSATISDELKADIRSLSEQLFTYISSDAKIETVEVQHEFIKCEERERIDIARRLVHTLKIKRDYFC
ncbi:hypothetical protein KHA80_14855 [Anaerobacillus sp. HL2]|nr:hypothetical protein KHA80_14855 [Anaerobacillus sp. HL2]